jgi:hypothetical protein
MSLQAQTHVRAAVPAIKKHLETLGRLDRHDIDVSRPVPQRSSSLGIVPVEPNTGEDARTLYHIRSTACAIYSRPVAPLTSVRLHAP